MVLLMLLHQLFISFGTKCSANTSSTVVGHRFGRSRKIDLSSVAEFAVFTVISVKMYVMLVDYGGSLVVKNHMYAVIH